MIKNILLVDDEAGFRAAVGRLLETHGYTVDQASDGVEAKTMLLKNDYDLLITDIVMPREDGIGLILFVRTMRNAPLVIAISGGGKVASSEYLMLAQGLKADATLEKPFEFSELLTQIKKL